MNIETLAAILVISAVGALLSRLIGGFTLAGFLASYLLCCLGAVGGWVAQQRLNLPVIATLPFPGDGTPVPIFWPSIGALFAALAGAWLWRPAPPARRGRSRR